MGFVAAALEGRSRVGASVHPARLEAGGRCPGHDRTGAEPAVALVGALAQTALMLLLSRLP